MSRHFSRETPGSVGARAEGDFIPTPTTPVYRTYGSRDVAKTIYEELMRAKPKVVDEENGVLTFKLNLR